MIAIYSAMVFTFGYCIAFFFGFVFLCKPIKGYWKQFDPSWTGEAHCRDALSSNTIGGVISLFSDTYSVLLPCLMLQDLQVSRRKKIGLNLVFALGLSVVVAGVGRTVTLYKFSHLTDGDTTWHGYSVLCWSIAEYELGIICACLPSLRVFMTRWMSQYRTTHSSKSRETGSKITRSKGSWAKGPLRRSKSNESQNELTSLDTRVNPPLVVYKSQSVVHTVAAREEGEEVGYDKPTVHSAQAVTQGQKARHPSVVTQITAPEHGRKQSITPAGSTVLERKESFAIHSPRTRAAHGPWENHYSHVRDQWRPVELEARDLVSRQ